VEIVAVCDVWKEYLERAAARVQQWYGRLPRKTSRHPWPAFWPTEPGKRAADKCTIGTPGRSASADLAKSP
jgi:hypothetical protein